MSTANALNIVDLNMVSLEKTLKKYFFSGPATKRGRGVIAWPQRKKTVF